MWQCQQWRHHVKWNLASVIVFKPPGAFFLFSPPLLQVWLSVTHLRKMWPSNKYICYPFEQFIELSEVSRPARPQIGPVRWEMERERSGPPSCLHHCRKGISIRPDRLSRGVQVAHGEQHIGSAWQKVLLKQNQVILFNREPVTGLISGTSQTCYVVYFQINTMKLSVADRPALFYTAQLWCFAGIMVTIFSLVC